MSGDSGYIMSIRVEIGKHMLMCVKTGDTLYDNVCEDRDTLMSIRVETVATLCQNEWRVETGKHINMCEDRRSII